MHQKRKNTVYSLGGLVTLAVLLVGWTLFQPTEDSMAAGANKQKVFKTPEAALEALLDAMKKNDDNAMLDIFGHEYKDFIVTTDKVAMREDRLQVYRAAQEFKSLQRQSDDKVVVVLGKLAWPLPVPIVRGTSGWRFDTEEGFEEVLNRRIGGNELNAIATAIAYVEAQVEYASKDRDGDQVLEYAQRIGSSKGKRDGLFWEVDPKSGEELSPFGPYVAEAQNYLKGRQPGDPYKGYYFKVLTRQGENPPGGRYDFVINGNMIGGFALVAFPADYGSSGIMTFAVSHQGKIYENDLGKNTHFAVNGMHEYNPDNSWAEVYQ
jgi:hypothetical protein